MHEWTSSCVDRLVSMNRLAASLISISASVFTTAAVAPVPAGTAADDAAAYAEVGHKTEKDNAKTLAPSNALSCAFTRLAASSLAWTESATTGAGEGDCKASYSVADYEIK